MNQKKMLQFFIGVLLLPWFGGPVLGEVGEDFNECFKFFHQRTPPEGFTGYQPICQRYKNQYRFATLYHREHRAPLYSAYILNPADGGRPEEKWKYEPQLATMTASPEMQYFKSPNQNEKESQAVDDDYKDSGYTRGHLTPSSHQRTEEDRKATFTLTNIVPQHEKSNSGPWNQLETEMLQKLKPHCKGPMYVITGVIPYESGEHNIKNRVVIPEYLWSAYCCPSHKPRQPGFPTYAAVGRNDPRSGDEIVKKDGEGYNVQKMSLEDLEKILKSRLKMSNLSLFEEQCKSKI